MDRKHNPSLTANAKILRKNMTREERHLWYDFLRSYPVRFMDIKETDSRIWNKETNMNKRKCLKFLGDFIFYGLLASVVIISIVGKWDPYIIPFWTFSFLMGFERWYKKRKAEKYKKYAAMAVKPSP